MPDTDKEAAAARADGAGTDGTGEGSNGAPRPPRKFVLFADGTGNAFTTQESNVWRLYAALDRAKPDQVAYYIRGVGTAGWKPLAALDGATGIGVPSNVRKLYRFLCWNWQPGDEIYIFGFSRGAFTARTLVGMIDSQGLVPAAIEGVPVSHGEMERNVMAAWREYRRETARWYEGLPTIPMARIIRDAVLGVYHFIARHRSYTTVRKAMDKEEARDKTAGRKEIPIKFLGLFDTVEAFGVPVEELRTAIDRAIWPISFRNRDLSPRVECARHALALDDERTTFHPIRINHPEHVDESTVPRVREVWFAGVHSDVGGGYPDGTLSYVPLAWMAGEIGDGLRFQNGQINHFREYQSAIGPIHDSRSGAAIMYRYGPRLIEESKLKNGGAPIVHLGVVERMLHGCDNYAPIMLPASARVLLQGGKVMPLTKDETRKAMKSAYQSTKRAQGTGGAAAAEAFEEMEKPDEKMAELARDTVWWRRVAYFSLVTMVGLLALWPWISRKVVAMLSEPTDVDIVGNTSPLDLITAFDYRVGTVLRPLTDLLQTFLPSYAEYWLKITAYYPFATGIIVILLLLAWGMNGYLRNRIQERARLAWKRPGRMVPDNPTANGLLKVGRVMRLYGWPLRMFFTHLVFPLMFLGIIFGGALLTIGRSYSNWNAGTGEPCSPKGSFKPVEDQPMPASTRFDTKSMCWGSGLWVEKGRKYRIWIDASKDPWFDRTIMSGVNGFTLYSPAHIAALPLRRWYKADWFQPILRIGAEGDAELPLEEINAMPADDLPRPLDPTDRKDRTHKRPVRLEETAAFKDKNSELRRNWSKPGKAGEEPGDYDPIPEAALPAAGRVWAAQGLAPVMVADFVAPESGEVFLYVNDAVQVLPFRGPLDLFYKNNSGSAQVMLQRRPLPAMPK